MLLDGSQPNGFLGKHFTQPFQFRIKNSGMTPECKAEWYDLSLFAPVLFILLQDTTDGSDWKTQRTKLATV